MASNRKTIEAYVEQLRALLRSFFALCLAPQHDGVDEGLRLGSCDVSEGCYQLVKVGVDAWPTDKLDSGLWLTSVRHALVDLLLGLPNEGVEQVVQRILADSLELVRVLVVPRLGAVVVVALPRRPGAGGPFRLALDGAALVSRHCRRRSGGIPVCSVCGGQGAVGRKSLHY